MKDSKFIALGFSTDLIDKIQKRSLTLTGLRGNGKAALMGQGFTEAEAILIQERVNRTPVPTRTVEELMARTGCVCCYCADGIGSRPYQIHHINKYSKSRDHGIQNLMLVCPNHHVIIHSTSLDVEEQLASKRAWENLWEIGRQYIDKGFDFPFGAFEYIDYNVAGKITDIFSFGPAKPSICEQLSEGVLLEDAIKILNDHNQVLLTGESGSGKTTLSLGIGAKAVGMTVYRYIVGEKNSLETMNEIVNFLGFSARPILLIVDDANTKLVPAHIEKILRFAQKDRKVLVVNTKLQLSGNENLEQRVADTVLPITWESIRHTVTTNLIKNEKTVMAYLKENGLDFYHGDRIGYSMGNSKLSFVIDSYASGTQSVWQFVFMLASGEKLLSRRMMELRSHDRLDLLAAFLAAEQIATVEQGASLDEIRNFFRTHIHFRDQEQPSNEWLAASIGELSKWRMIKRNRDRYNLAHRMLARGVLEQLYLADPKNTSHLLDSYFYSNRPVRQILILWSWLTNTTLRDYTSAWKNSLGLDDWKRIGDQAAAEGLSTFVILTDRLHPSNKVILEHILAGMGETLGRMINRQDTGTIYYFNQLAMAVRYNAPEIWPALLGELDKRKIYVLIRDAQDWELDKVSWLLGSIRECGQKAWILSLTDQFEKSDFAYMADRLKKGDIQSFSNLMSFWRGYVRNIIVGEFIAYMSYIPKLLKDCMIKDFDLSNIHSGYYEIFAFPELIDQILLVLDPSGMAEEYVELTPDQWGSVLVLSNLSSYGSIPVIQTFMENLDLGRLMVNIKRYYREDIYNFRLVIHQLAYDEKRKNVIATLLEPLVQDAVEISISQGRWDREHESILDAFSRIDPAWVDNYCNQSGITLTKHREEIKEETDHEERVVFKHIRDIEKNQLEAFMPKYKIEHSETASS